MKKLVFTVLALSVLSLIPAKQASAVDVVDPICESPSVQSLPVNQRPSVCQGNQTEAADTDSPLVGPNGVLTKTINILSIVLGIIAVIVIMVSGIRMSLSQANPQSVNSARNQLIYAIVGLVVAAIAQSAVVFIIRRL